MELTHLRHELAFDSSIALPGGEAEVTTIYSGTGPLVDPDEERLSEIIARINERFGTDWTDEDRSEERCWWALPTTAQSTGSRTTSPHFPSEVSGVIATCGASTWRT